MRMSLVAPGSTISTILRYDAKVTSYKIALLRAINDVVLSFPDVRIHDREIAIPLRMLSEYWIAYYWPFVALDAPILQGPRSSRDGVMRNDMAFRPALTALRAAWESVIGGPSRPADGFFLINELRVSRRRVRYPSELLGAYRAALTQVAKTLEMPIRYAGPGEWTVFPKPLRRADLDPNVVAIPGTRDNETCLVIAAPLWQTFCDLSLWVEALCIHEWCLFTEGVTQERGVTTNRGMVYNFLTDRPDNRRPLTWERNNIDLLIMEGHGFVCPWTQRQISVPGAYDLDHVLPVSVYPINELWNLVPVDRYFNQHQKRDRVPSQERLQTGKPHLQEAYTNYETAPLLMQALHEDVAIRFAQVPHDPNLFAAGVAEAVVSFIDRAAQSRNLARF
jgi:hypothetical protein